MKELVELKQEEHGDLKLDPSAVLDVAKRSHIVNLRVNEVGRAICEFPAFLSKSEENGDWSISAIMAFEVENNLFVRDKSWQGIFEPSAMLTYPFYLMNHPTEEKKYTIGFDPQNAALSKEEGEPLFDGDKAGQRLSFITAMLQENMKNDVHTFQFCKLIDELGLIKPIDVAVTYSTGAVNTLKGLNTIDEAKLAELSEEQFKQLREKNYLAPLYALLMSLQQLNRLIRLHNEHSSSDKITQVNMSVPKDESAAA